MNNNNNGTITLTTTVANNEIEEIISPAILQEQSGHVLSPSAPSSFQLQQLNEHLAALNPNDYHVIQSYQVIQELLLRAASIPTSPSAIAAASNLPSFAQLLQTALASLQSTSSAVAASLLTDAAAVLSALDAIDDNIQHNINHLDNLSQAQAAVPTVSAYI